jgi:dipeptidyl aminopeptidase/acylaminoacyl peptidase
MTDPTGLTSPFIGRGPSRPRPFHPRGWSSVVVALLVLLTAPAALPAQGDSREARTAEREAPDRWTPDEQMRVRVVGGAEPSPDGHRVAFTVTEPVMTDDRSRYLTHIWIGKADGTGARPHTRGEDSASNPRWSPDGRWIAFTSSRSGTAGLWRIPVDGGEAEQLTDLEPGVGAFRWSPDGSRIAFVRQDPLSDEEEKARERGDDARVVGEDHRMAHLWVFPVEADDEGNREPRRLTEGPFTLEGFFPGFDWSPDGSRIAFTHQPSPVANDWPEARISIVEVETGEVQHLPSAGAAAMSPLFSPDGEWIAYAQSDDPPTWAFTRHVHVMPAAGGESRRLAPTFDEQPNLLGWTADSREILFSETHGTTNRLSALPIDGSAPRSLSGEEVPVLSSLGLDPGRSRVAFAGQASDRPPEVYVTPLDRWAPVQVSQANGDAPDHPLGRTEVLRWSSADGREIEGLITYPVGFAEGTPAPLLVMVHGGPTGVYTQSYIAARGVYPIASYAAEGFAVFRPNFRGSSGYGREFRYANYNDWGVGDFQDIMSGVDHLVEEGVADPDRMGIMGWSYGGFMTSWTITRTDRFRAASIGAPVTNLMSFSGTADIPGFIPDYFGTEFWNDLEPYRRHSAMFNIGGASTPSLIQHGEEDLRVPLSQGQELHNALHRQGVTVRFVTYPRQPHSLNEPRHVLHAGWDNVRWFREHVLEREAVQDR